MGAVDSSKRKLNNSKTDTGKPVTKVEVNPKVQFNETPGGFARYI